MKSFGTLVTYSSAVMWLFYGAVGVAVVVTRGWTPGVVRPYEVGRFRLTPG